MLRKCLALVVACLCIVAFIAALHLGTQRLGGSTGKMIAENQKHDREVYAYVYSELGHLEEFLDDESGSYGRKALVEAIADGD